MSDWLPTTVIGQQTPNVPPATSPGQIRVGGMQYDRKISLVVANAAGNGFDLSQLRVTFRVTHWNRETASLLQARIYNMKDADAQTVKKEFTKVIMRAGYQSNFGVIFSGTIKQCRIGRESPVDTYMDVFAADGDLPHNWGVINTTLSAGYTPEAVNKAVQKVYGPMGVTVQPLPETVEQKKAPRGKVLFGLGRGYLRDLADTHGIDWRIRAGVLDWLPQTAYKPGEAIVVSSASGMVGTPQQTEDGVAVRVLLNPAIDTGTRIWINNKSVQETQRRIFGADLAPQIIPDVSRDGFYKVLWANHSGDTRGNAWYTDVVCLAIDSTIQPVTDSVLGVGIPP